ncbi:roadblock/LC7 domain-containing protein [Actinosynnema sp. NPDC020468]|uniref:roadblock/LC7 domain-containing protein n=1 Tax=Actinosynnema sp. NPDC020468 TaxID=3154488 RepID=UPI003403FF1A
MTGNRVQIRLTDPDALGPLLARVRAEVDGVDGLAVTSRDGIVVAADLAPGTPHPDDAAAQASAMGAASAGVGQRFVQFSGLGRLQSVLLEGDRGCIAVQPLSGTLLLVVLGTPGTAMGLFTLAVRRATAILLAPE